MRRDYYQVVGRGPWTIDHPNGVSTAYRPGNTFEESALNKGVVRGLRTKRLRKLSDREAKALKALAATKRAVPVAEKPEPKPEPKPKPAAPKKPKTTSGSSGGGSSE